MMNSTPTLATRVRVSILNGLVHVVNDGDIDGRAATFEPQP